MTVQDLRGVSLAKPWGITACSKPQEMSVQVIKSSVRAYILFVELHGCHSILLLTQRFTFSPSPSPQKWKYFQLFLNELLLQSRKL